MNPAPTLQETGLTLQDLAGYYSDSHKEAYGFRPRHSTKDWSFEDFEKELTHLQSVIEDNIAQEKIREKEAVIEFEAEIARLIEMGAKDRSAAIRWIDEAEETNGDRDYLRYVLGLPYGYFNVAS